MAAHRNQALNVGSPAVVRLIAALGRSLVDRVVRRGG
jgi:hypothetical protein